MHRYGQVSGPAPIRLSFVMADGPFWGQDTPTPWREIALPDVLRHLGPTSFFLTQFSTGEFEYPWVWALVVAHAAGDVVHTVPIVYPTFDDGSEALAELLRGAAKFREAELRGVRTRSAARRERVRCSAGTRPIVFCAAEAIRHRCRIRVRDPARVWRVSRVGVFFWL
jgi:hypothetical protein